jgi:hypothetical protein
LDGLDTGDYRHLTATQKTDLTDSGASSLHYHTSDRARANHTGTQATSTLTSTAYRTFYSDSAGDVQPLAHGSNGQVLTSNGASANPSWQDAAATYTNEMAQDAVGGILYNSPEISLTYVDGNPSISGDIIAGSIDILKLDSGVQDSLDLADSSLQSGDNISELVNDSGYITSADGGNATTLDSLDSTAFLRSNTSDSFTNGTLTISTGTELLVDGLLNVDGTINIASTTISLDGPSTDFNADGGTITFNTNDLVIKTSTGYIGINETDPRAHLDVAGSGYFYNGVHTENHDTSAEWKEAYDWGDHSTQGYLIDITNESIGDLTNVDVTGAANGKVLKYNSGTWEIADDNDTTYTAGSFNHNDLDGLNDGTSYQHITQTEKTNFGTAYTHSGLTSGNPHSVSKSDVALDNVPNVDCTNASNITSGTISSSILPPVALTEVTVVVSEVAQLALTAEEGDVAVRSDENKTYMHNGGSAGTMADWTELQTPTDTVLSVNGETGTVVLTTSEIGEDADHNYVTDAQLVVIGNTSGTNTGDQSAGDFSHNSLDDLNVGTNYQHITTTQESNFESAYSHISNNGSDHSYIDQDVTSGSSPTFDGTNFSGIPGTALDDTYIKANGAQALTANWDAGGYEIRARTLESDVATGTAPLTIASTTLVNNLNSDKLDNQEGSYYLARGNHTGTQLANTISDFDTEVANNSDVSSNTSARHTRSHTMTSTSDHTAGEWKVFYSNAAGVQELALGSSGKVLTANGTSSAPTWETPASVSGFVPYTGATSDVDLGEHDLDLAGMLSLNPVGATVGSIRLWDNNTEYLELKCEGNSGFITVDTDGGTAGNLYLTSNLTLFSTGASRFNGDLTILGDLLPNSDSTYDIGSTGTRWQTLYVDNITTTDDGTSANWKAAYDWGDHDGLYADLSHSHGNINNDGEIGTTANLPIITTTGGVLTTGSFGSSANTFCEGDDSRLSDARTPTSHDNTYHSTNYAAETVTLTAGTGLTGGGNLTTNRTFAVSYGTSAGTACQGNDSRLHTRSHAIDGASDHTATAYRTFYSDSAGDVQQLSHGTSGQVLTSNGASADPSWQDAAGGGVPYTGATADVDLGSYDLTATDGTFDGDVTLSAGNLYLPESSSTEGAIYINGTRVFHTYAPEDPSSNTFVGRSCGNTSSITHTTDNEGRFNVGVGYNACPSLTTGYNNMCVGTSAGRVLSSGHDNLCIGFAAGYDITTGQNNVCMGTYSGFHIAGADYNVALGARPLYACVTGDYNTAIGFYSLYSTTNSRNIGIGANAGRTNTSGFGNIFIGYSAGFVSGQSAISSYEIGIGYLAKVTGNRGIAIGYQAEAGQDEAVIGGTDTTRTSLQGDLCIDDCAAPGATNGATIAFPDNDGEPDPATGTACIYAQDVAGSGVHMFAISETGTGQRISPHDPVTGEWVFYGFNTKTGKRQQVNMEKMVRTIEELTGEQFLEEWYE